MHSFPASFFRNLATFSIEKQIHSIGGIPARFSIDRRIFSNFSVCEILGPKLHSKINFESYPLGFLISRRGLWSSFWLLRCFKNSWRWASWIIISVQLFCSNLVIEAHAADLYPLYKSGCEDVHEYYSNVGNLKGEALKKKLNSIISIHQSLSYKEVLQFLQIFNQS